MSETTSRGDLPLRGKWQMEITERDDGVTIINDAHDATALTTAVALKELAGRTTDGRRSIAVLGGFRSNESDALEEHDGIGRLIVRLNISQLIAVGSDARHIQAAAGLEGSWDGESLIVDTTDQAYDLLRDEIRPGDVVLVKAARFVNLGSLGDRLAGVIR